MNQTIDTFTAACLLNCPMAYIWELLDRRVLHAALVGGAFRFSRAEILRWKESVEQVRQT